MFITQVQDVLERFKDDASLGKPLSTLRDICFELVRPNGELRVEADRMGVRVQHVALILA